MRLVDAMYRAETLRLFRSAGLTGDAAHIVLLADRLREVQAAVDSWQAGQIDAVTAMDIVTRALRAGAEICQPSPG